MPQTKETGVDESDPTNTEGKGSDGAADQSKERMVPLAALDAERKARQKLETELARVSGTVEGLKSGQQKPTETTTYTRTQLRAMVNEGKITEDQMDTQLEIQQEAKFNKRIEERTAAAVTETRAATKIGAELAAYTDAHPDLLDEDSDTRAKVQTEFDYLVGLGDDPKNPATELKAVRAALGQIAPKGRRKQPEMHEETGGSGGDSRERGADNDGWAKGLTSAQKAHYTRQVNKGIYKDFNDKNLKAEIALAGRRRAH